MKLAKVPDAEQVVSATMRTPAGYEFWTRREYLSPVTVESLGIYIEQIRQQNLATPKMIEQLEHWKAELEHGIAPVCIRCQAPLVHGQIQCSDENGCRERVARAQ